MELADLIELVGRDRYAADREAAWRNALPSSDGVGGGHAPPLDVPHDLCDPIWFGEPLPPEERVRLSIAVYQDMPCYANLMYVRGENLAGLNEPALQMFWDFVRTEVGSDDPHLGTWVAYWLWVDIFEEGVQENQDWAERAWRATIDDERISRRGVERVLAASGPVPYSCKHETFTRLAGDRWDPWIFSAIVFGCLEMWGEVDFTVAADDLHALRIPGQESNIDAVLGLLAMGRLGFREDQADRAKEGLAFAQSAEWGPFKASDAPRPFGRF